MSKISTYEVAPVPKLSDKLIGTSVGGEIEDVTYNFTLQELLDVFLPVIPANNLQGVLDYGNTATQNINLFGTITTTNLSVTNTANLFITYLNEETHLVGSLFDSADSVGTAGQVLTSTGDGVEWFTLPPIFTPNLEQVLTEGNTSDIDIILDANLEALDVSADTATVGVNLTLGGTITDNNSAVGSAGQVLESTVTGVQWTSLPVYSATSPLLFNSGTGVFSIQPANSTQGGYLTANDWVTFDGKQNAGAYITALTGEATATGPGSVPITLNNASVIAKVLTGLNVTGGSISASDSILTAFGKVQSQINGLMGGVQYQGVWNASTNTPTLTSSVGTQGHYYIVNVAGSTDLNGITDWKIGDWAIFSGGTWQKVDNTESVTSVNGQTGAVSLTTDNIPEGAVNLYYLDSRARGALSFAAGSGAYNSLTGVITIPTNNNQILNGANYITLASLSATGPLAYNNLTGVFSIQQATALLDGYLSAADWTTFNNKQNYLGGTGLVKSTAGTITYITDNSGNWNTAYNDSIISASVTGTTTKTLTLNQQDGGTIQASWTDIDTGLTSVGVSMPAAFSVANSPLTANGTIAITGAGSSLQYIDGTGALQTFPGLTGFVPYTGANQNVDLGEYGISAGYFQADLTPSGALQVGRMQWNNTDGTMDLRLLGNNVTLQIGQENVTRIVNKSGIDLLEANYQVVRLRKVAEGGAQGQRLAVVLAQGNNENNSTEVLGLVTETINSNQEGFITCFGEVKEINTTGSLQSETWVDGDILYISTSIAGQLTNIRPVAPNHAVIVGYVSYAHAVHGKIYMAIDTGYELGELHNVYAPSPAANQSIYWNVANSRYQLNTIGGILGYTPANAATLISTTAPLQGGGDLSANRTLSITQAGASADGYLSSTDWNTFNNKQPAGSYVPTSRLLSINGTQYDLSADRSWSVGTVTSVAALTLGTSGTDLSSSVATGTTTPVITLNVPTASAANRGALSAADWSTFNTKVGSVTASSPLASSGGSTPNITIQQASGSQDGYLSSADWTTFNNKQAAGNYITSLTGEATASGPGAAAVTLNNASVTAKVLTGVNITGGTVLATDTMLTAFGKLQNQINGLIGGSIYQGTWNASTNTPTLTSGVGTKGYYYIVSVAGNTNLDGITDWFVGDWAIFDGTAWQQVDNTDAVVSVNGQTGAVSLTTDNIPEGATNQYFLNSRARAALSFAAGSGAYNSTSGLITIPTNTNQLTNGASFITLASLSGTAPIQYNNTTGAISITQAGTASNGYLSSTDWNTFNNKQSTITNPVTGTGTPNRVAKWGTTSSIIDSYIADQAGTATRIDKDGTSTTAALLAIAPSTSTNASILNLDNAGAGSFYIGRGSSTGGNPLISVGAYDSVIGHTGTQNFNVVTNSLVRIMVQGGGNSFFYADNLTLTSNYRPYFIAATTTTGEEAGIKIQQTGLSNWYFGVSQGTGEAKDLAVRDVQNSRILQSWDFAQQSSTFQGFLQVNNATYSSDWALNVSGKGYIGANPNASGAILYLRDSSTTGSNTTFGGLFLGSAPGNDFAIGKKTTNSTGSFEIRVNGTTTVMAIADTGVTTLSNLSGTGSRMVVADANGSLSTQAIPSGTVTGTGTANYLSKWSGTSSITDSIAYDDGTKLILNGTTDPNINDASTVVKLVINGDQHFSRQSAKIYFGDVTAVNPLSIGEGFQADSGLDKDFMSIYHRNKLVILGDPSAGSYYPTAVGIGTTTPGSTVDIRKDNAAYNRIISYWSGTYISGWKFSDSNGGITYDAGNNILDLFANWATDGTVTISTTGVTRLLVNKIGVLGVGVNPYTTWNNYYKALQIGAGGSISALTPSGSRLSFGNNHYNNTSNQDIYISTDVAGKYIIEGNSHYFQIAASGTVGTAITWTTPLVLESNGTATFTGNITIAKTTPGLILNGLGSGNSGAYINLQGWAATNSNWQIGVANIGNSGLTFTPSTAAGGTTFSSPVIEFASNGRITSGGLTSSDYISSRGPLLFTANAEGYIYNYARFGGTNAGCLIYNNGTGANMFFGELAANIYGFANGGTSPARSGTALLSWNIVSKKVGINIDDANYTLDVRDTSTGSTILAQFQTPYDALNEYGVIRIGQGSYYAYFGQMLQTYDVAFMGMNSVPSSGNGIYYSTANRAGINVIQPNYSLDVNGNFGVNYPAAFASSSNQAADIRLNVSIPASSTFNSGGIWSGITSSSLISWGGSSTINAGAINAGIVGVNRHTFTSAGTITLSQSGGGIRTTAALQVLQQTGGSVNGTISHGASLFIQGIYPTASANITYTNYYGLLINNLTEWGGVTLGTRYGIYQAGTSDTNYFAAQIIAQGSNGALSVGGSGYTLNPSNMLIGKYTTGRGYIQVPDNGQIEFWDGGTTEFLTVKAASIKSFTPIYSTYTKSIATPNGGTQTVRIIEDALGQWILVGRFAANAMSQIQGTWSTVSGLAVDTLQSTATAFSADFGDAYPTEVRVMGATDFNNWRETRTIDFVYRVPAGRQWKTFFNGGNADGTFITSGTARYGWDCAGTYDGFGRWNNPNNTQIGMSDGAFTNPSTAYTTPSANAINWNTANDAKMTVIHTGLYSGQDVNETTGFGVDDNVSGFFDTYPSVSSNMSGGNTYSSAVWILIKLN